MEPDQSDQSGGVSTWLVVLQGAWFVLVFLVLSLFGAGIAGGFQQLASSADLRALEQLNLTPSGYAAYLIAIDLVVILAHIIIAAIIYFRRPNDWMAILVAIALVANGAIVPVSQTSAPTGLNPTLWDLLRAITAYVGLVTSIILLTLFPDGRFIPSWTRPFAAVWALLMFFTLFFPDSPLSISSWSKAPRLAVLLVWSGIGAYAQVDRFLNISTPLQRQQTKWALLGLIAAALSPLAYFFSSFLNTGATSPDIPNVLFQRVGASFFALSLVVRLAGATLMGLYFLLFPLSFAVAILRYRLWDIDILIRRTLIYSVLTGLILVIYFGSVLILQASFLALTGQGQSEITTIFSTLAIAALFVPLRNRVQEQIDKRFYQRKYDATKTLIQFSETLREEVNLDQLCQRLLNVVEETMQPEHVSLWLRGEDIKTDEAEVYILPTSLNDLLPENGFRNDQATSVM